MQLCQLWDTANCTAILQKQHLWYFPTTAISKLQCHGCRLIFYGFKECKLWTSGNESSCKLNTFFIKSYVIAIQSFHFRHSPDWGHLGTALTEGRGFSLAHAEGLYTGAGCIYVLPLQHDLCFMKTWYILRRICGKGSRGAKQMCLTRAVLQGMAPAFATKHMLYFLLESWLPLQMKWFFMCCTIKLHRHTDTEGHSN